MFNKTIEEQIKIAKDKLQVIKQGSTVLYKERKSLRKAKEEVLSLGYTKYIIDSKQEGSSRIPKLLTNRVEFHTDFVTKEIVGATRYYQNGSTYYEAMKEGRSEESFRNEMSYQTRWRNRLSEEAHVDFLGWREETEKFLKDWAKWQEQQYWKYGLKYSYGKWGNWEYLIHEVPLFRGHPVNGLPGCIINGVHSYPLLVPPAGKIYSREKSALIERWRKEAEERIENRPDELKNPRDHDIIQKEKRDIKRKETNSRRLKFMSYGLLISGVTAWILYLILFK